MFSVQVSAKEAWGKEQGARELGIGTAAWEGAEKTEVRSQRSEVSQGSRGLGVGWVERSLIGWVSFFSLNNGLRILKGVWESETHQPG